MTRLVSLSCSNELEIVETNEAENLVPKLYLTVTGSSDLISTHSAFLSFLNSLGLLMWGWKVSTGTDRADNTSGHCVWGDESVRWLAFVWHRTVGVLFSPTAAGQPLCADGSRQRSPQAPSGLERCQSCNLGSGLVQSFQQLHSDRVCDRSHPNLINTKLHFRWAR